METQIKTLFKLRYIEEKDNQSAANIIRQVLEEHGCTGEGFASSDPETDNLFLAYKANHGRFWVLENTCSEEVVGCGGFSGLKGTNAEEKICELQKVYLLPHVRGQGLGKQLLSAALKEAKDLGYNYMYLESVEETRQAVSLYEKLGFKFLEKNKGNSGHQNKCSIYMILDLQNYKE